MPILLPSSWLKVLLEEYPFLLGGGCDGEEFNEQLSSFWTLYEFYQPGHEVYKKDKETLQSTIPILVHGDEGRYRYLKKGNFMICTVECPLGCDTEKKHRKPTCVCHSDGVLKRYGNIGSGHTGDSTFTAAVKTASKQHVNDTGNEFLSKFLAFGMSSLLYKKHKGLLNQAFEMMAKDLTNLHEMGIVARGRTFYASTIGCKGDVKFHHQIGNLQRSYYNVGTNVNHPICSLCLAGTDGVLFEDLSNNAPWMDTMFTERPWGETPVLATVPFQPSCPEAIFRLDLFHCWKCGLGRDLTGSTLVVLCRLGYFDSEDETSFNFPSRLQRSHSSFSLRCMANRKSPALHSFSKAILNYKNERSFAWFNVKGSDNTLITAWLLFVVRLSRQVNGHRYPELEDALIETLESAKVVFNILHSHTLWMSRLCAQRVQHHMTILVRGYKCLALEAKRLKVVGYSLKPKMHALDHINKDLKRQLDNSSPRVLNPMIFSCEANESVVGHTSRIARRLSSRTVSHRVLDRICIKVKVLVRRLKVKLRSKPRKGSQKRTV